MTSSGLKVTRSQPITMNKEPKDALKEMQAIADQFNANNNPPHAGTCPACGHCPHCGRGGPYRTVPYPSTPYPYWTTFTTTGANICQ